MTKQITKTTTNLFCTRHIFAITNNRDNNYGHYSTTLYICNYNITDQKPTKSIVHFYTTTSTTINSSSMIL